MPLPSRQRFLLLAALQYAVANIDDLCDAFAAVTDDDPDNVDDQITVAGLTGDSPTTPEFADLAEVLGVLLDQPLFPKD